MNSAQGLEVVPAGTLLWRVHRRDETVPTDWVRVAFRESTALAEHVLYGAGFTAAGTRKVSRRRLTDMVVTAWRTTTDLVLVCGGADARRPEDGSGVVRPSVVDFPQRVAEIPSADPLLPVPRFTRALDDVDGVERVNDVLRPFGVRVRPPAPADFPVVFVSYRNGDCLDAVVEIDRALVRAFGAEEVFLSRRSLPAGVEFSRALLTKVAFAKVLLVVIGPRWSVRSEGEDWVRKEIATALGRGVEVVPVVVGLRQWIRADELPEDIREIAALQHKHMRSKATSYDFSTLVDELCQEVPVLNAHRRRDP